MNTLINGNEIEKAKQSFKILDIKSKNYLNLDDFREINNQICILWNAITGARIKPSDDYS